MTHAPRVLALAAGLLLAPALSAQDARSADESPPAHVAAVSIEAAPSDGWSGPIRVVGRTAAAQPLVSGTVHVWATLTPGDAGPRVTLADIAPLAEARSEALPAEPALLAPYPNPSADRARVPFEIADAGIVRLSVFDALGREVAVLVDGQREVGRHAATLDAGRLAPGLYHVRLSAGAFIGTTRFTVVR